MMVGRLLSYWEGNFSGDMLNFGRVVWHTQKGNSAVWNRSYTPFVFVKCLSSCNAKETSGFSNTIIRNHGWSAIEAAHGENHVEAAINPTHLLISTTVENAERCLQDIQRTPKGTQLMDMILTRVITANLCCINNSYMAILRITQMIL